MFDSKREKIFCKWFISVSNYLLSSTNLPNLRKTKRRLKRSYKDLNFFSNTQPKNHKRLKFHREINLSNLVIIM